MATTIKKIKIGNVEYPIIDTDTKNTAGASNNGSNRLYLVGAQSQSDGVRTYSNSSNYIESDVLYTNGLTTTNRDGVYNKPYCKITTDSISDSSNTAFISLNELTSVYGYDALGGYSNLNVLGVVTSSFPSTSASLTINDTETGSISIGEFDVGQKIAVQATIPTYISFSSLLTSSAYYIDLTKTFYIKLYSVSSGLVKTINGTPGSGRISGGSSAELTRTYEVDNLSDPYTVTKKDDYYIKIGCRGNISWSIAKTNYSTWKQTIKSETLVNVVYTSKDSNPNCVTNIYTDGVLIKKNSDGIFFGEDGIVLKFGDYGIRLNANGITYATNLNTYTTNLNSGNWTKLT